MAGRDAREGHGVGVRGVGNLLVRASEIFRFLSPLMQKALCYSQVKVSSFTHLY